MRVWAYLCLMGKHMELFDLVLLVACLVILGSLLVMGMVA